MRRFVVKIITFSLILFALLIIADYVYSKIIIRSNYRPVEAWSELVDGKIDADLVVLGSSRVWVQVDPHIMDSVLCANTYNLSIDGSAFNRQVKMYDMYRICNSKPEVVVLNLDIWSLGYQVGYEMDQFFPYFWDSDMRNTFFDSEPFTFGDKYIPFWRYSGLSPLMFLKRYPRTLTKGFQGQDKKWNGEMYNQQKQVEFEVSDTTLSMLKSFLARNYQEDVKVVFLYAPLYSGATNKIINAHEVRQIYQDLADEYDIPILDYGDMWICNDTTYFYNAMHLNIDGAEIFTDSLANDIRRLNLL